MQVVVRQNVVKVAFGFLDDTRERVAFDDGVLHAGNRQNDQLVADGNFTFFQIVGPNDGVLRHAKHFGDGGKRVACADDINANLVGAGRLVLSRWQRSLRLWRERIVADDGELSVCRGRHACRRDGRHEERHVLRVGQTFRASVGLTG